MRALPWSVIHVANLSASFDSALRAGSG